MKQIDVENSRYLLCEHCESIVTAYLLPEKSQEWEAGSVESIRNYLSRGGRL